MIKVAGKADLPVAESIMRRIHDEDPSFWPYGLDTAQFNGGLYLMQKSASEEPVGFVGWQSLPEDGRTIGYYAVGVLPEHRRQGFAKQAVSQVISDIGKHCDEVRALIMEHNEPSKAMARSLRVPILEKLAAHDKKAFGKALKAIGAGGATAGLLDLAVNKDKGAIGAYALKDPNADKWAGSDFLLNALAGAAIPAMARRYGIGGALGVAGAAAAKTIATPAVRNQARGNEVLDELKDRIPTEIKLPESTPAENWAQSVPKSVWLGAGGLGIGALGLLAYNAKRNRELKKEELAQRGEGRIHVTLPTKKPGDVETNIELPVGDLNMSKALRWRLGRDTRRRLNEETSGRTRHRPQEKEQEKEASIHSSILSLVNEISMRKYAAAAPAPNTGVPTPPQLGQNPAMRMQQQEATAKSIQPSTDANPQIMQAQQAAAQAEQQAAMQSSEQQQQAAAAQMEQQQAFSQQLAKSEQEKEVLKLQLEKEKAIAELNTAKSKSEADATAAAGKGEGDAVQRMATSRIGRLHKRIGKGLPKSATTVPLHNQIPPNPGLLGGPVTSGPVEAPLNDIGGPVKDIAHVRRNTGNLLNKHPGGATQLYQPGVWRRSYGGMGDSLMEMFASKHLYQPDRSKNTPINSSDAINSPDTMATIARLYGQNARDLPQFGGGGVIGSMKNLYSKGLI